MTKLLKQLMLEARKYDSIKSFIIAYNDAYSKSYPITEGNYMDKNLGVPFGDARISFTGTECPMTDMGIDKFYQLSKQII